MVLHSIQLLPSSSAALRTVTVGTGVVLRGLGSTRRKGVGPTSHGRGSTDADPRQRALHVGRDTWTVVAEKNKRYRADLEVKDQVALSDTLNSQEDVESTAEIDQSTAFHEQPSAVSKERQQAASEPSSDSDLTALSDRSKAAGSNNSALTKVIRGSSAQMVGWIGRVLNNTDK